MSIHPVEKAAQARTFYISGMLAAQPNAHPSPLRSSSSMTEKKNATHRLRLVKIARLGCDIASSFAG
ncbi:MAG: hypothetical protein E6417_37900, partial [Bradyrhizobium sp.]|nr:hypothetical protein [Bradyrhizobium sp.]